MSTIHVIDDDPDFRESTRFWLAGAGYDVRVWDDPGAAIDTLAAGSTGRACVLLDLHLAGRSGLDVHAALEARGVTLPVIYMSGAATVPLAVRAMQQGAVTLLEKPLEEDALEAALAAAFADRPPVSGAAVAAEVIARQSEARAGAHAEFVAREARLTPREREVLGFVILGVYNKNIADRIGLSIKTVELYRARGMAKMQARSVAELTRMMVSQQVG